MHFDGGFQIIGEIISQCVFSHAVVRYESEDVFSDAIASVIAIFMNCGKVKVLMCLTKVYTLRLRWGCVGRGL